MGTSNQYGTATAQVTYPNSSFQPNGNTTDYVGTYNIYFNQSASLAQSQFSVGFLDSTTYHRGNTVTIGAVGYQPNQAATLSITNDATGTALLSSREYRRHKEPRHPPRIDHPSAAHAGRAGGDGGYGRLHPPFNRHRGCGGHQGRHRPGTEEGCGIEAWEGAARKTEEKPF